MCLVKIQFRSHISRFQLLNLKVSPILALFYADASFSGQHMTHHPIYSKFKLFYLLQLLLLLPLLHLLYFFLECSICTKMNQVSGSPVYNMNNKTADLQKAFIPPLPIKCDCTTNVGLNSCIIGRKIRNLQRF